MAAAVSQQQQWAHQPTTTHRRASSSCAAVKTAQASSSSSSARHQKNADVYDRFYGHRDISELSESVISALFACPLDSTSSSVNTSSADSSARPTPRLAEFIAYALHRTRLPSEITFQALFLLRRLKSRFPAARGSSGHRLFISALMLASKSSCDDTYSNKSWTIVSQGLFTLMEVNQMERELFGYLGYKVNVEYEELNAFTSLLKTGDIHSIVDMGTASANCSPMVGQDNDMTNTPTKASAIAPIARQAYAAPHHWRAPSYTLNTQHYAPVATQHLSPSMASMSSRGSISSASGYSLTPSPTALTHSESSNSSRTSPDTPPSEFDASPWTDDGKATFSGEPAGTYDDQYHLYHQSIKQQQYYAAAAAQQQMYAYQH